MRQPALGNFEVTESITTQRALPFLGAAQKSRPVCATQGAAGDCGGALPKRRRMQTSYFTVILVYNSPGEKNHLLDHFASVSYGTRWK